MLVAAVAVPPGTALMAICGTGESAIVSLNVAVIVIDTPCRYGPGAEYAIPAVGFVLSTVKLPPLVGVEVSVKTPDVSGGVNVRPALFPAVSFIVPPFRTIGEDTATPPLSPDCTV